MLYRHLYVNRNPQFNEIIQNILTELKEQPFAPGDQEGTQRPFGNIELVVKFYHKLGIFEMENIEQQEFLPKTFSARFDSNMKLK